MYQTFLYGCGPYCLSIIIVSGKVGLIEKKMERNDFDFHCSGAKLHFSPLAEAIIQMSLFDIISSVMYAF